MSVIAWTKPENDLTALNGRRLKTELAQRMQGRANEAFIFGSFASGTFDHESDIDLVIVKETKEVFTRRPLEFVDLFDVFPRLDILVYTPTEFKSMLEKPDGFFNGATLEKLF